MSMYTNLYIKFQDLYHTAVRHWTMCNVLCCTNQQIRITLQGVVSQLISLVLQSVYQTYILVQSHCSHQLCFQQQQTADFIEKDRHH